MVIETERCGDWSACEIKRAPLAFSEVTASGLFEGYASLFNVVDLGRDSVMPGAFRETLTRNDAARVKMLWQHEAREPIGRWLSVSEDAKGLKVRGRLNLAVARAREVLALMREGAVDGLSIGFRTERAVTDRKTGIRYLHKLDLWEISVVTFPMLPQARVSSVKRRVPLAAAAVFKDSVLETRLAAAIRRALPLVTKMGMSMPLLETKSAGDAVTAFEEFHRAFAAFRETNDERLAQIEDRLSSDVVTDEKLARIDRVLDATKQRVDQFALERARPHLALSVKHADESATREHKTVFHAYLRSGEAAGLKGLEEKTMSVGSGPDGGYLVPIPAEAEILRRMAAISPIRSIASVRSISTGTFKKAYSASGPAAGWVAETDVRTQGANPQLVDLSFPAMELYAMPAATQTLLDDAAVDLDQWIADEIDTVFAEQEGAAFVSGNGANKPTGFLSYTKSSVAGWSFGKTAYVPTGVSAGFAASNPGDGLIDLIYALKAGYRQNARFVMNRKTQAAIRKFKATTGEYLWAPPATLGASASLMNFPVVEAEDMPDIGADSYAVAFGDFARGYLIVDRIGIRVLRDPYSAKPYVLFYTTKRVGGGIQDFDAIKLMKFGVS